MKFIFFIIAFFGFYSFANSQRNRTLVRVKDWGQKSFLFSDGFWDNKKDEIAKQIGEDGFAKVVKFSDYRNVPSQMNVFDGQHKKNASELNKKLNKLKVYKTATFEHIFQGKDWGQYSILEVPYSENADWDSAAKWDTVYFIIKSEQVEENN